MDKTKIAIIGAGWLGQQLISQLPNTDYDVLATARSEKRLAQIKALGATPLALSLPASQHELIESPISQTHWLVIAITPGFKRQQSDYGDNVSALVSACNPAVNPKSQVKGIILLSSTGVYGDLSGQVDETTPIDTNTAKTKLLRQAEQSAENASGHYYVLRLAGLFGKEREPGKFLANRQQLPGGEQAVNMVHGDDVVETIINLINNAQTIPSGIYNCVASEHPTKQAFYHAAADRLSLPRPSFTDTTQQNQNKQRIVCGDKLQSLPEIEFQHNQLIHWLKTAPITDKS